MGNSQSLLRAHRTIHSGVQKQECARQGRETVMTFQAPPTMEVMTISYTIWSRLVESSYS